MPDCRHANGHCLHCLASTDTPTKQQTPGLSSKSCTYPPPPLTNRMALEHTVTDAGTQGLYNHTSYPVAFKCDPPSPHPSQPIELPMAWFKRCAGKRLCLTAAEPSSWLPPRHQPHAWSTRTWHNETVTQDQNDAGHIPRAIASQQHHLSTHEETRNPSNSPSRNNLASCPKGHCTLTDSSLTPSLILSAPAASPRPRIHDA